LHGRDRVINRTAGAGDRRLEGLGMNFGFHGMFLEVHVRPTRWERCSFAGAWGADGRGESPAVKPAS
jgi:hypothetical protein